MRPGGVFILGAGRAGRAIAAALAAAGRPAIGLHGRRAGAAPAAAPYSSGEFPGSLAGASTVLVAVRDADLDAALLSLVGRLADGVVVLHLSGATDPAALGALRAAGLACGTFHPLVPLADAEAAVAVLRGAYVGVDGDDAAVSEATALATLVGAHAVRIPDGRKASYHAAAVLASNFPVVLAAEAMRLLGASGIGPADAHGIVAGLLSGAATNVRAGDPAAALTGPAVRGDVTTVRSHLRALAGDPELRELYACLTRAALRVAAPAGAGDVLGALAEPAGE